MPETTETEENKMGTKREVPVTFDGFVVGTAIIDEDGGFSARLDDSPVAEEIRERILSSALSHVSFNARIR